MKAVIIAHGTLFDNEVLIRECESSEILLCADGGAEYAKQNNLVPDFLIGDFDSVDKEILEFFMKRDVEVIKYPCDKDFTDTEICIDKAISCGADEIAIFAGIGSRLDHSLGNISLLQKISDYGIKGYLAAKDSYIYLCADELTITGEIGDTLSVLPFMGEVTGVTLKGLKYPLNNATIKVGQSIGLSNVLIEKECKITVAKGELLVIKYSGELIE